MIGITFDENNAQIRAQVETLNWYRINVENYTKRIVQCMALVANYDELRNGDLEEKNWNK